MPPSRKHSSIVLPARLVVGRIEAGCDEAGRGCIAGPVVAAAVILPPEFEIPGLTDSKQLTAARREALSELIRSEAIDTAVAYVSSEEIDKINILQASFRAMTLAIEALCHRPEHLLIDGNRFQSPLSIPHSCIVKGDQRIASIAAASILAKTSRDAYMHRLHEQYPYYGWDRNMGYPTAEHLEALKKWGCTAEHRRSFGPCQRTLFETIADIPKESKS